MRTANDYYRQTFGCKVYKLCLDGGFTCPNRDGTLGTGGCAFCSGAGGGEFAQGESGDISRQLELARQQVAAKCKTGRYIAYFQSFTGTYAPVSRLKPLFEGAMEPDWIVGLSVATRPDCLRDEKIALLKALNEKKPVSIELGLQTASDAVARDMNRCYDTACYIDTMSRLRGSGMHLVTHIILGLPGETPEDMLETTRLAVACGTHGVKFHLLHVLKDTALAQRYSRGEFRCLTMEEYGSILKRCIALLPPETVVHRITGDGARKTLLAPLWSLDKKRVLNYLNSILRSQDICS